MTSLAWREYYDETKTAYAQYKKYGIKIKQRQSKANRRRYLHRRRKADMKIMKIEQSIRW